MQPTAATSRVSLYSVFAVAAFLMPPVAVLSPNAVVILLFVQAAAVLWVGPRPLLLQSLPRPLLGALTLLLVLGLASATWSLVPKHSLEKVGQLLGLFAGGLIVTTSATMLPSLERMEIGLVLARGIVAALALLPLVWLSTFVFDAHGTFFENVQTVGHYKRGVALLVLLAGPAAYALFHRYGRSPALVLMALVFAAAYGAASGLAMVAAGVGIVVTALAYRSPAAIRKAFVAAIVALFVCAPLMRYAPDHAPQATVDEIHQQQLYRISSAFHRFFIWQFAAERATEKPFFGWGLDASRAIPGGKEMVPGFPDRLPLHPHNNIIQFWLELGALGALIAGFAVVWSALRLRSIAAKTDHAVMLGVAAALLATALTGWSVWQSWWMASMWLVVAFATASLPGAARQDLS